MKNFAPFSTPLDSDPSLSTMRGIIERFETDARDVEAYFNLLESERDLDHVIDFYRQWQKRLTSIDFDTLDLDDQIDFHLLHNHLKSSILRRERKRGVLETLDLFLPFRQEIIGLLESRREKCPISQEETARTLSAISRSAGALEKDLAIVQTGEMASQTRLAALRSTKILKSLAEKLSQWNGFYQPYDPRFAWWTARPFEECRQSLESYQTRLAETYLGSAIESEQILVGEPLGRDALVQDLACEWIPYSPEELIQIGQEEYQWCERQMIQASRDLGFDDDWKRALDHTCRQHLNPGEQPELIRNLAEEAISWVVERDLVALPPWCAEGWEMAMMPAEKQRINPYFLGGQTIYISFPTASMSQTEKTSSLRGNNIHFCRATVHHELIPGHHLQLFMSERYRRHRKLFTTPFLIEGWALHWEFLLWDQGFAQSPENRIGMLFWRMHRCARVIFSLRFHLGEMDAEEAVQFLIDRVGHEPGIARAEMRRSISDAYPPLYQAAYLLGALQMQAMYREFVQTGIMSAKQFHDAVLRQNAIPLELMRFALSGQSPEKDSTPGWRFYPSNRTVWSEQTSE